jgi:pimeloyl-ACP methyl ester carboxylesterase
VRHRLPLLLPLLLIGTLVLLPAAPLTAAEKLDKKRIEAFAKAFFQARPWTRFESWDLAKRRALMQEAKAFGAIPEGSLDEVVKVIWAVVKKQVPKRKDTFDTPYGKDSARWIQKGGGGAKKGLVLGLHGGGPGAGNASEAAGKWTLPGCMAMYPHGVRLVHDTWNSVHGERFLLSLIEYAKARHDIDPDRVYSMGFSMGGTGSWFLAGRHPDLLAGAIPAHGVLMCKNVKVVTAAEVEGFQHGFVPNARNLAVYFYTGSLDKNCEPGTFLYAWDLIQGYRKQDPDGWDKIRFAVHEGVAHTFPSGEPGGGFKYIREHKRDTFPKTLVWEYADDWFPRADAEDKVDRLWKRWFYWLHCDYPVDRMQVRATLSTGGSANEIDLQLKGTDAEEFTIYLNPEMIDVAKEVVVRSADKEIWRGRPQPDLISVIQSLDARLDRRMVFDRRVVISPDE